MRAKFLGAEPHNQMYWLECPRCGEQLKISAYAFPLPEFDVGPPKPFIRCPFCGCEPHIPGPRDRALDRGLPDPGVEESFAHAMNRALADQARRAKVDE